jgi:hypothetical protein
MIINREEVQVARIIRYTCEVAGIVFMALLVVSPVAWNSKVLGISVVSFFIMGMDWAMTAVQLLTSQAIAASWRHHLALRMAIDGVLSDLSAGKPKIIDWHEAMSRANSDIKSAGGDDGVPSLLAGTDVFPNAIAVGTIALIVASRVLAAIVLAYVVEWSAPGLINWINGS